MSKDICYWKDGKQYWLDNSGNTLAVFDPILGFWNFSNQASVNGLLTSNTARYKWDFSVTPSVSGVALNPLYGVNLPAKAVVTSGQMYVKTAISGGTNGSIQLVSGNDIVTAAAISGAPWSSATTLVAVNPVSGTANTWVTVATASQPQYLSTAAASTVGVILLFLHWIMIE